MKIQCNACEAAEAAVLCCADEAALCRDCDEKVHAANKLASKHQRIPLITAGGGASSSRVPKCDICQEASGYFFCLEDRAILCRKCDVSIHTANPFVALHQRFLLTGVQVGLEPFEPPSQVSNKQVNGPGNVKATPSGPFPRSIPAVSLSTQNNAILTNQVGKDGGLVADEALVSGFNMTGGVADWPLDEFFGFSDFNQNFGFTEHGSSKADYGKLGSSEGSPFNCSADEELDFEECLGQVPEFSWKVPEMPSPPTASGLHWQREQQVPSSENCAFVPDIYTSPGPRAYHPNLLGSKRRRHC